MQALQLRELCALHAPSLQPQLGSARLTKRVLGLDGAQKLKKCSAVQGGTCIHGRAHLPELVHVSLAGTTAAGLYLRRAPALAARARVLPPRALPRAAPSGTGVLKQIPILLCGQRCLHSMQGAPGLSTLS